ncbi:MAG TPA: response regulator [Opitutaceae bacterium]|nr:response regulator [Opitutaceae bacterium]
MTTQSSAAPAFSAQAQTTHRVLVADDDSLSRLTLSQFLNHHGFACTAVESGAEALHLLQSSEFDVIIADINMEGNFQLELVRTLRQHGNSCPIILITGNPSVQTATSSISLNVAAYLTKPIDHQQLISITRLECERASILRLLSSLRSRQDHALGQLRSVETAFTRARGREAMDALQVYLSLSFEQMVTTLIDLKAMLGYITDNHVDSGRQPWSATPPVVLVAAIQETIQVLERTRSSFKSQELGSLRKKLEELLQVRRSQ